MSQQANHETKVRRTQADRTADTRRRALDATIRCLARDGYAATTTTKVAQEAGISRGGMLHHFPTRAELLSETLKDIEMTLRRKRIEALSKLPPDSDMFIPLTRIGWESYQSEEAMALIELAIARIAHRTICRHRPRPDRCRDRTAGAVQGMVRRTVLLGWAS